MDTHNKHHIWPTHVINTCNLTLFTYQHIRPRRRHTRRTHQTKILTICLIICFVNITRMWIHIINITDYQHMWLTHAISHYSHTSISDPEDDTPDAHTRPKYWQYALSSNMINTYSHIMWPQYMVNNNTAIIHDRMTTWHIHNFSYDI